jgi:hypothetical protein
MREYAGRVRVQLNDLALECTQQPRDRDGSGAIDWVDGHSESLRSDIGHADVFQRENALNVELNRAIPHSDVPEPIVRHRIDGARTEQAIAI